MAQCACCNAPISRLTEAVCWRCREILDRKVDAEQARLTARRDGQDFAGGGVDGDTHSVRVSRAIIPGYGLPEKDAPKNKALPREAGSNPARQHSSIRQVTIGLAGDSGEKPAPFYAGGGGQADPDVATSAGSTPARQHPSGAVANGQASALCASVGLRGSAPGDGTEWREGTGDGDPGSNPGCSTNTKPQRVRFGPGALPVTESRYQRYRREAQAYYDAMLADVTSSHVWPGRECAGGCGCLVNGPLDKCRLCATKSKKQLQEVSCE